MQCGLPFAYTNTPTFHNSVQSAHCKVREQDVDIKTNNITNTTLNNWGEQSESQPSCNFVCMSVCMYIIMSWTTQRRSDHADTILLRYAYSRPYLLKHKLQALYSNTYLWPARNIMFGFSLERFCQSCNGCMPFPMQPAFITCSSISVRHTYHCIDYCL